MKTCYIIVLVSLLHFSARAQQDPLYSQYVNNPFVLNPAYAGLNDNLSMNISYRQQWSGIEGGPKTLNANGHMSLYNNRAGAGLMIVSDKLGATSVTEVFGSGSYRIHVATDKVLSFGLQTGIANYQIDNSKVNPFDKTDPLFQGNYSESKPTFGAGVILKSDKFFVGLSVPRMLKSTLQTSGSQATLYTQHFYALGSYLFFLTDRIRLKPSMLIKAVSGAPASVDLNASLIFHENYSAGLLTRNFNTYGLFMMAQLKDSFRLGYVFEVPTGKSVGSSFTTHEITLGFRISALTFHNNSAILSF